MEQAFSAVREDDSLEQFVNEAEIDAFCDQIVGAWNDAHQGVSPLELLKEAILDAEKDGTIKDFIQDMLSQDDCILVGLFGQENVADTVQLSYEEIIKLLE